MPKSSSATLLELLTAMESIGELVTIQQLRAFAIIAAANEIEAGYPMRDLESRLGMPSATRTRVIDALSVKRGGDKLRGMDLVLKTPDPHNSKATLVFLTPKGRRTWASFKHIVE
jgi:DNA-binding MarR family transcriptional regulator